MDEIRCPMCSELNPADAETCRVCGARLRPLVAGDVPQGRPEENGEGVPDWLERMRSETGDLGEEGEGEAVEGGEAEAWLNRLRGSEAEPEASSPREAEEAEVPDWLGRLGPEETAPEATSDEGDLPDWLAEGAAEDESEASESEAEASDWLGRLRETEANESASPEPESSRPPEPEAPHEPVPDTPAEPEPETPAEPEPGEAAELEPAPAAGDVPDWLGGMRAVEPSAAEGPPEGEIPDWLSEFDEEPEPEVQEEVPDWLARIRAREEADTEVAEPEPELPEAALEGSEPAAEGFPWEAEGAGEPSYEVEGGAEPETEAEGAPGWLEGVGEESAAEPEEVQFPHVPALVFDEEAGPPEPSIEEIDFDAIELPDWLSDVRSVPTEAEAARDDRSSDLAPASLPSWLEAMRPVETFGPLIDLEPEIEETVETVGPLAGLRGVLSAEPAVAKPRAATIGGARLEVSERQFAQVEILRRMVAEEEREVSLPAAGRRPIPILRWILTAVILVGVMLPSLSGLPTFPLPTRVPRDLGPLITLVNDVPLERPVLLVFDYEPGFSGELDAVAGALVQQILTRDLHVVTLSTRPTGPPLADRLIRQIGAQYSVESGRNYLHLGYLSGGPTAVQLFAAAPRDAVLKGFRLPADLTSGSGWDSPILSSVERLSDFGMVAVITAGTDHAREWAEQAHPYMGDTPLVMVLSAGAEPLVRPYFEALNPQVNGILAGLPAAAAYEQVNDRPGAAQAMWNSYGSGVLTVEIILAAGVLYGLATWLLRWREAEA